MNHNQFLTNYTEQTFLDKIRECLRSCNRFYFSVSFIKKAGLVLLLPDMRAAVVRGAKGRVITSTYQNFTDVESLKSLLDLKNYGNFDCHLDFDSLHDEQYLTIGYHSKGYLFEYDDCEDKSREIIVGSSNITRYALLKNIEWDLAIAGGEDSEVYGQGFEEFTCKWNETEPLSVELISKYATKLNFAIERWDMDYELSQAEIKPNYMQRKALKELNRYRAMGIGKALVVASAGSGKTFLAAFDALNFNPNRLLYIVHEGSILQKSLETFQMVFGNSKTYGIYNGENKDLDADFVFASNFIMSKNLELFDKECFDYVVIDECHHAAAKTYKDIINYFKPEFLIGLTATPERMDNQDVFDLFDQNVPYELRLRDAIINDLVVPFKYYGIRDTLVDYNLTNKKEEHRLIAQLADETHCSFVIDEIEKHRPEGKLKALAFCKSVAHARMMSEGLGEKYKTAYLTGSNNIGERVRAYNDLQSDTSDLEILCTVDILNEGVDIPGVNMVLFLRPTESSTVFIQQLGRGLRKYENKPYVTVLDFIGNSYKRSVQIAFALGSLSKNLVIEKRLMMSLVNDDFSALGLNQYGVEIHIDDLSKEEINDWLENENFNAIKYMKQDYFNFKQYVNCADAPKHVDYLNNDCAPDLQRFMSIKIGGQKTGCYYNFLKGIEESNLPIFSESQVSFLKYASGLLPLVRPDEFKVIEFLMDGNKSRSELAGHLAANVSGFSGDRLEHVLKFMLKKNALVNVSGDKYAINVSMYSQFSEHLKDLLDYGLIKYDAEYVECDDFLLWHNYSMNQVQLKLLKDPDYNQLGTYVYGKQVVIFASLKKDAAVEERLKYNDKFLEPGLFQWECENNISGDKLQGLIDSDYAYVFIRKVSEEHGIVLPFTYVGKGKMKVREGRLEKYDESKNKTNITYMFDIEMENELPDYLQYDYGVGE